MVKRVRSSSMSIVEPKQLVVVMVVGVGEVMGEKG